MLDYGTIDDILKSTENMAVLRNSLNDDSTDTIDGVDWFQYNGKTASKLYVSGNSWMGIGENTEHLRIPIWSQKRHFDFQRKNYLVEAFHRNHTDK